MKKIQIGIRFPEDVKRFIDQEATRNCSSANSEVIRAIRERMDRIGNRNESNERASA